MVGYNINNAHKHVSTSTAVTTLAVDAHAEIPTLLVATKSTRVLHPSRGSPSGMEAGTQSRMQAVDSQGMWLAVSAALKRSRQSKSILGAVASQNRRAREPLGENCSSTARDHVGANANAPVSLWNAIQKFCVNVTQACHGVSGWKILWTTGDCMKCDPKKNIAR